MPWPIVFAGWGAVATVMLGLWAVQRRTANAGVVDVAWSFATGALGATFALTADGEDPIPGPGHDLVVPALRAANGACSTRVGDDQGVVDRGCEDR